jgi:hypothetical protein
MFKRILIVLLFLAFNQMRAEEITINWSKSSDGSSFTFSNITKANEQPETPFYAYSKWYDKKIKDFSYSLQILETKALNSEELAFYKNLNPQATSTEIKKISSARDKGVAKVLFSVIIKNASNQWLKIVKFNIEITNVVFEENTFASPKQYKSGASSVLASGRWFRMTISSSGIYKIDKNFLSSMGVDVNSINPQNIKVYGSGGMLPEKVKEQTFHDLPENAIYVAGENDNTFDDGDYVLFYAKGPHEWKYDSNAKIFKHYYNFFSDVSYYFITFDGGLGKRIIDQSEAIGTATDVATTFDDFGFYENDYTNLNKSGRVWLDKPLNISSAEKTFAFSFPNLDFSTPLKLKIEFATRSSQSSGNNIYLEENGNTFKTFYNQNAVSNGSESNYATLNNTSGISFTPSASSFNIKMKYAVPNNEAECWLNYIEIFGKRNLQYINHSMSFRYANGVKTNGITNYNINSTSNSCVIWDITNPFNVAKQLYTYNSGTISFQQNSDSLKEYVIFDGTNFSVPTYSGQISNQDIHSASPVDYVIVSAPEFLSAAQKLADFHHDKHGLSVLVVTPNQVYNEFSSGSKDIGAIRNMMQYFYSNASNASELPKYLLLLGDASYDYKNRRNIGGDFVPTFESYEYLNMADSYASDDFYSFLDPNEGDPNGNDLADIGVGRIPVSTLSEADGIVNKIIAYSGYGEQTVSEYPTATPTLNASFGDWRNKIVFVADDGSDPNAYSDYYAHVFDAESSSLKVRKLDSNLNQVKLYFDAYKKVSSAATGRYPDIEKGIEDAMTRGALIVHYIGHGGEAGWADERVLTISNVNKWTNFNALPFFVTATCEFSRFDDPERLSAGELSILNTNGGVVGQLTTSRLVYGSSNLDFTDNFYDSLLVNNGYNRPTVGAAIMKAKQTTSEGINNNKRKFYLMGDPAMTLAFPSNKIAVNTINMDPVAGGNDTIKALMKVKIEGEVQNLSNQLLNNFNGILYATIYDKMQSTKTMNNNNKDSVPYKVQSSIIYKGKATVVNGLFSLEFITPKDINYLYGNGRISLYAANANEDAAGFFENFIVGGNNASGVNDNVGPQIRLFMNDSSFVYGGLTDENPKIFALIYDESGINTTGNAIGHDLTAILDNVSNNTYILNSNYESDVNSYQHGKVQYQLNDLSDGMHSLSMKVWDVNNNSSTATTEFLVAASAQLALSHVLNYPNPFTTSTQFWFEHNFSSGMLDVQIQIMNINGKVVKTINTTIDGTDRSKPIPIAWDGTDDFGDSIGRGVYIYRIKVKTDTGMYAEKMEKLVILK